MKPLVEADKDIQSNQIIRGNVDKTHTAGTIPLEPLTIIDVTINGIIVQSSC